MFGRPLAWPEEERVALRFVLDHTVDLTDKAGNALTWLPLARVWGGAPEILYPLLLTAALLLDLVQRQRDFLLERQLDEARVLSRSLALSASSRLVISFFLPLSR
mgnify:CR=1 FL=1